MMAYQPHQPYGGYNYQQNFFPYVPPRFDGVQSPQNAAGVPSNGSGMSIHQTPQAGFLCIPVTSFAQVEAFQIPFDGSTTYFVDTSNGKLYSKTFDFTTGTAVPVTYIREQSVPTAQYATRDDLKALRDELLAKPKKAVKKDDADE